MIEPLPPAGLDVEEIRDGDGHRLLALRGELDLASVPGLEAAVSRLCTKGTSAITLDLSRLSFIDSTGLAVIVFTGKLCEKHGYEFELVQGSNSIQRLFELTGLIDVLPFRSERQVSDRGATPERVPPPGP
jgi:anti-sigma B factor antagonist